MDKYIIVMFVDTLTKMFPWWCFNYGYIIHSKITTAEQRVQRLVHEVVKATSLSLKHNTDTDSDSLLLHTPRAHWENEKKIRGLFT